MPFLLREGRGSLAGGQGGGQRLVRISDIIRVGGVLFLGGGIKLKRRWGLRAGHTCGSKVERETGETDRQVQRGTDRSGVSSPAVLRRLFSGRAGGSEEEGGRRGRVSEDERSVWRKS